MLQKVSETRLENGRKVADYQCDCGRVETWPVSLIGYNLRARCSWCLPLRKPYKANKSDIQGETAIIYLEQEDKAWSGALIDYKDFRKASQYFWADSETGPVVGGSKMDKKISLAKILLDFPEGRIVYKNGNPFDCRRENLEIVTTDIPERVGTMKALGEPFDRQGKNRARKYLKVQCEQCGRETEVPLTDYLRGRVGCIACGHKSQNIFAPGQCTIKRKKPITFFFSPQDQEFFREHNWGIAQGVIIGKDAKDLPAKSMLLGQPAVVIDGDEMNLRRENLKPFNQHSRVYKNRIRGISYNKAKGYYHVTLNKNGKRLADKNFRSLDDAVFYHVQVSNRFLGLESPYWDWDKGQVEQLAIKAHSLPAYKSCPLVEL